MTVCTFTDFAREWSALLMQDGSASLDRLFEAYTAADAATASPATIEDLTDLWAAAKRANLEWEATCMVRSVRQSTALGGALTQRHLMTAMVCWAATLLQRSADFFKECKAQVHEVVDRIVAGCSAGARGDEADLWLHVLFCAALELFGWHSGILTCLHAVLAQPPQPTAAQDTLERLRLVGQRLTPRHLPRGLSTDSTPNITTGRASDQSSSSDHDGGHVAPMTGSSPSAHTPTLVVDYAPSHRRPRHSGEAAGRQHVRFEQTSAAADTPLVSSQLSSPTSPVAPTRVPPLRGPPQGTPKSRPVASPLHAPQTRGTPQCTPKSCGTPSHAAEVPCEEQTPLPPPPLTPTRRDSAVTASSLDGARREEGKERRKPTSAQRRGKASSKRDGQNCVAF